MAKLNVLWQSWMRYGKVGCVMAVECVMAKLNA